MRYSESPAGLKRKQASSCDEVCSGQSALRKFEEEYRHVERTGREPWTAQEMLIGIDIANGERVFVVGQGEPCIPVSDSTAPCSGPLYCSYTDYDEVPWRLTPRACRSSCR